jgi:AraC-like DNA-binding protein
MFLRSFQAATGRSDLHLLTLTNLQGMISQPSIFRNAEAWCPNCLEQWRKVGVPVYSPLLWAIRTVTVCPAHATPLVDRCPHCHSQFASLRVSARLGYCSICSQWLGNFDSPSPKARDSANEYNLWAATAVGQVLVAMPELQHIQPHVELIANLQRCLRQSEGATRQSLAVLAGTAPCAFLGWASGRTKPALDHLCRLTYELKIPLMMLFKGVPAHWRGPEHIRHQIDARRSKSRAQWAIGRNELRSILTTTLSEDPPPSVAEVARRLKFHRAQTLWSREPELCRQIAARRRHSGTTVGAAMQLYKKSERRRLESILRGHLARENPLSLNEIASRLGYKGSGSIRERFPELCREIAAKRKQQFLHKREQMQRALEDARAESPPPSLKQIARRFGFTAEGVLSTTFPQMCVSHKQWRRAWLEEQRTKLRLSIRDWMAAEPAPTVTSVCRRFGISQHYFQLHFPEENADIVRRSAERVRIARENRDAAMRKQVFEIVRKLRLKKIYPSLPRVRSALSPGLARYWQLLRPVINEAVLQFGGAIRQRNEFGQFV